MKEDAEVLINFIITAIVENGDPFIEHIILLF